MKTPKRKSRTSLKSVTAAYKTPATFKNFEGELRALSKFQPKLDLAAKNWAVEQFDAQYIQSSGKRYALEVKYSSDHDNSYILQSDELKHYYVQYRKILPEMVQGLRKGYAPSERDIRLFVSTVLNGMPVEDFDVAKAFLMKISENFPTGKQLAGSAKSLRKSMIDIKKHSDSFDIVGTGGDGHNTFNISTATALVVSALDVKVAKHGNRSASSLSGAADVLEALGVNVRITPEQATRNLEEINLAFLFAQTYHQVLRNAAPLRKAIGKRTIFNLLGPLSNPARAKKTLLGVYHRDLVEPMAQAMLELGTTKTWIVHGKDGLDEVSTTSETIIAKVENGKITRHIISPEKYGLKRSSIKALKGGDARENAKAIRDLLDGKKSAFRDAVLLNTAVALTVANKTNDIRTGIDAAKEAIGSGRAKQQLRQLKLLTNSR